MTTFDCRSCGGHWNEGPTRNHRYDCLCRKCLEALARESGKALLQASAGATYCVACEEYDNLHTPDCVVAKLHAAGLLSADDHT